MTIGIVIPLKSKQVARDWRQVCLQLERTVHSIEQQSSDEFVSIVVGHERPDFFDKGSYRTCFHQIELPPPDKLMPAKSGEGFSHANYMLDKNCKIVRGMQLLSEEDIDYWFPLDGDDLIHRNFVKTLTQTERCSGYLLNGGILLYSHLGRYIPTSELSIWCGSSVVIHRDVFSIPAELDEESMKQVPSCRLPHFMMHEYFEKTYKDDYRVIEEPLVAYSLGHGDNLSDRYRTQFFHRMKSRLKPYILGRKISKEMSLMFSMA